ncbi:MAG: DUF167 domain-containing protein [Pseudomonadota bacterium]
MQFLQETAQGIVIKIYVQPRSSRNRIIGLHGDSLKIAIQAPPVDDAANRMCIEFLSKCLNLPRSAVEMISGHTSRMKRILLRLAPGSTFPEQMECCKKSLLSLLDNSVSQGSVTRKKTA